MNAMSNEQDYWGDWPMTQPPRTDTVLPRKEPPVVLADPVAVGLVCACFAVALTLLVWAIVAVPEGGAP